MSGVYVSASQIRLYMRSPEEWRERYLRGKRTPSTQAQELGREIHASLEAYLTGRGCESANPRARDATKNLQPFAGQEKVVEYEVSRPILGLEVVERLYGFIDLAVIGPDLTTIVDHKTTANPDRACRSEWELATDIQMLSYAWGFCEPGDRVQLVHHYILTSGPVDSWLVRSPVLDWDEIEAFWETQILPTVRAIDNEWSAQKKPVTVPVAAEEDSEMILCVHCMPSKGDIGGHRAVDAYEWLRQEIELAEAQLGQPYTTVKYAEGVNTVVRLAHEAGKFDNLPPVLVLPDRSSLCERLEAQLRPFAAVVLNGVH